MGGGGCGLNLKHGAPQRMPLMLGSHLDPSLQSKLYE